MAKVKIRINSFKFDGGLIEDYALKQQLSMKLIMFGNIYDYELDDFGDYCLLTIDEKLKDKAIRMIEDLKGEYWIE